MFILTLDKRPETGHKIELLLYLENTVCAYTSSLVFKKSAPKLIAAANSFYKKNFSRNEHARSNLFFAFSFLLVILPVFEDVK